jgi:hypothetical protein
MIRLRSPQPESGRVRLVVGQMETKHHDVSAVTVTMAMNRLGPNIVELVPDEPRRRLVPPR